MTGHKLSFFLREEVVPFQENLQKNPERLHQGKSYVNDAGVVTCHGHKVKLSTEASQFTLGPTAKSEVYYI